MTGDSRPVVGLGQCSLDILGILRDYPDRDQKAELQDILMQGGGPAATALVALARLGVDTAFVGRTGGDDHGTRIRNGLLAEGVDCSDLLVDAAGSSQVAFIVVDMEAHRNIFWHRGSAAALTAAEVDPRRIAMAAILHLDGLQLEASLAAAEIARGQGIPTVLDGGSWREGTVRLLPLIDHLVVSEKFARQAGGDNLPDALRRLSTYGARAVTVTMGKEGSLTMTGGAVYKMPAFVVRAVDTTGCGDVFHGGYIYGLLRAWDIPQVVRFAAACAALKTRALGGRTAIPFLSEVLDLLDSQNQVQPELLEDGMIRDLTFQNPGQGL